MKMDIRKFLLNRTVLTFILPLSFLMIDGPMSPVMAEEGDKGSILERLEKIERDAGENAIGKKLGLSLYGYVDLSYTQNFNNPSTNVNQNRVFNVDSNSFRVQMAQIVLEREGHGGGSFTDRAGFRTKLNFGEDAEFTGGSSSGDDVDFQEVYLQFVAPVGNDLDLRFGRMNTLIGYEVIEAPYNPNFSRSWLFGFGQPFTTTGIRGSYEFNEYVSWSVGLVNDFKGSISDDNNTKGVETALFLTPTDNVGVTLYGYASDNDGANGAKDSGRLLGGGILDFQVTDDTEVVLEGYYANQANAFAGGMNARWGGGAAYVIHDFNDQWGIRFRGEVFEDSSGFASCFGTGTKPKAGRCAGATAPGTATVVDTGTGATVTVPTVAGAAAGFTGQTLWEGTLTLQYKPVPPIITRLEFRYDKSDQNTFQEGSDVRGKNNQQTLAFEAIYLF